MKIKVANLIARYLLSRGVKTVFGIPGTQSLEAFDGFSEEGIDIFLTTSEYSASFMADGFSRSGGGIGVLLLVPGPGLTYSLTGMGESLLDNVPVIYIVTDIHTDLPYEYQLHQIDQPGISKFLSKRTFNLKDPSKTLSVIHQAFEIAVKPPQGPVVVNIPSQIFGEKVEDDIKSVDYKSNAPQTPEKSSLKEAVKLIEQAERIGILAGLGCMDASEELTRFAEKISAAVATTISGRGCIPENHPLSVGYGFGPSGTSTAEKIFKSVDLLIVLGVRVSEVGSGSYGLPKIKKTIHIDADRNALGKNLDSDLYILSDVKEFLREIEPEVKEKKNDRMRRSISKYRQKEKKKKISSKISKNGVDPGFLVRVCRELFPENTVVTTDAGAHTFWVLEHFPIFLPKTFLCPVDYQAMGYSIPSAIGAAIANPEKTILCTAGDGGFLYTGFEILSALSHKLNVKFLLFNDGYLGLIREFQKTVFKREVAVKLHNPDFEKLAESFGIPYVSASSNEEVPGAIAYALSVDGSVLIDVNISYESSTKFIKGALKTHLKRLPFEKKIEGIKTAIKRAQKGTK